MTRSKLLALALASVLLIGAVGPAAAATGSASGADSSASADTSPLAFTLADNQTDLNDSDNETDLNDSENETDLNDSENETENGTDGNVTTPFGQQLQTYMQELQNGSTNSSEPMGVLLASWVVAHNPGNAPDHAGPPAWAGPGDDNVSENETQRGPPGDRTRGPDGDHGRPEWAGPSPGDDDTTASADEEETEDGDTDDNGGGNGGNSGNGGGPPENHGGGPPER